jgi:hypothetical protein
LKLVMFPLFLCILQVIDNSFSWGKFVVFILCVCVF